MIFFIHYIELFTTILNHVLLTVNILILDCPNFDLKRATTTPHCKCFHFVSGVLIPMYAELLITKKSHEIVIEKNYKENIF